MRLIAVENRNNKPEQRSEVPETATTAERRRIGRVVHDKRGNAKVEFGTAPDGQERLPLSVDDTPTQLKPEVGYDPYQRPAGPRARKPNPGQPNHATTRTDLRKLSEWIKQMRALEERKRAGDNPDEDGEDVA
jgi:hypothetical protein